MMKKLILLSYFVVIGIYASDIAYLQRKSLTASDVNYLNSKYLKYSSLYNGQNEVELKSDIPIISTIAHHHSVQYWLGKELLTGNIKGLPLLHFDSHTDMGHSPAQYLHKNKYLETKNILVNLNEEKIKSFHNSLTDISQVLIPALSTNLTSEFHMCVPPWFNRLPKNSFFEFDIFEFNRSAFFNSKVNRYYPILNGKNTLNSSPFEHTQKLKTTRASMQFYDCFNAHDMKIKSNYILSLDLDILSTNGEKHDYARPVSFHRKINSKINEEEFTAFKKRLKIVSSLILKIKKKGFSPKIITIADSTEMGGGGYTPNVLGYLANMYFRDFFRSKFSQSP